MRSLSSGAALRTALIEAAEHEPDAPPWLYEVAARIERGEPARETLERLRREQPGDDVRLLTAALIMGLDSESGLSGALQRVGELVRDRQDLVAEVRAQTAQARLSAAVVAALPIGFVALESMADRRLLDFLVSEPLGRWCLVIGLVLDITGWLVMRWLIARTIR